MTIDPKHRWRDLEIIDDPDAAIAVLPLAATEQHGPHLPLSTDADIMDGMLARLIPLLPDDLNVRFFPVERVGASDEHTRFGGTQTLSAYEMIEKIVQCGMQANKKGFKKLVLLNSHGGNEPIMAIAALVLRKELDMMVVKTSWSRFGVPDGLFSDDEMKIGIHGGDYETSLMLAFAPETVDMSKAEDFDSATTRARQSFKHLAPQSPHGFAWLAGDLNENGVVGNAAAATVEKGEAAAKHQVEGFVELLQDIRSAKLADWIKA